MQVFRFNPTASSAVSVRLARFGEAECLSRRAGGWWGCLGLILWTIIKQPDLMINWLLPYKHSTPQYNAMQCCTPNETQFQLFLI